MSYKFQFPKFKKGDKVLLKVTEGEITAIEWAAGKHWYCINGKFFEESEIRAQK